MRYKKDIGDSGEQFAAEMLEASGFYILERNYRTKVGEIDIIACRDGVLHFVEVKTRTGTSCGYPAEAVTEIKRQRIRRAAEWYLGNGRLAWRKVSFDVLEVFANLIEDCM